MLSQNGFECHTCSSFGDVVVELGRGATGLIMPEEGLGIPESVDLMRWVDQQPTWSDLPIILLTRQGIESPLVTRGMQTLGNVTLLERPTRVAALVSSARAALRARERQYEARAHLVEREHASAALRESERRYRILVEQVKDYAIFMTDRQGRATSWNEGVERVLGFDETEFIGADIVTSIFTPEDVQKGVARDELEEAAETGTANNDRWMRRKDGTPFWASGITTALYDEAGEHLGFTKVMRDLTHRKAAEDTLKLADRRKDEFLATLAHELRNPLAPIRNSLQILRMTTCGTDPASDRLCEMMERQVNHMVRLVDDLLEVSRITRGQIELRKEQVELASIIRSAVETSKPLIEAASHQLAVSLPAEPIPLYGDPVRLAQIVANLLNNAAKYTNDGGQIWLTARSESGGIVISVRDNGIGIDEAMQPHVFDMFTQVDRNAGRSQGGLGIGLTLVRSLVEMHGGTVQIHSPGRNAGTEFVVRLPLPATPIVTRPKAGSSPASVIGAQRVLVVDDNRDSAVSLGMLLKFLGAEVEVVHDGRAALAAIERFKPAVVLLDLGMPEMDGYEVAAEIRKQPKFAGVLLIALTGWGQDEDRRRTHEAGFNHHLVKPADISSLQTLLSVKEG
jgi:PAS domain S-box-containing protein